MTVPRRSAHPQRTCWLALLGVLALPLPAPLDAGEPGGARRPNIVLILVDDLGKEWLSCYGAEGIATPQIDDLAATGMRFDNFYVMPQCTPTRVTLMTGQYPFRHGWVNHWDVPRWGGGCSFDPARNPCLPRQLQAAGYATVAAGKWQIDDFRQEPQAMSEAGFDQYLMWTGYEAENPPSAKRYEDPYVHSSQGSRALPGRFGPDVFADFLIEFLQQHRQEPMFVYYPMVLTHSPLVATPLEPAAKGTLGKHRAMVRYVDHLTGRLVQALERLGLREQTLILWTTDNGTSRGIVGRRAGRDVAGGKSLTLESGVCVPLIASWPGTVPMNIRSQALVDITDFLPTLVGLAGAALPEGHVVDGHSFESLLRGQTDRSSRTWILAMGGRNEAELSERGVENRYWFRDRVLRNERFKLYFDEHRRVEKLVDLRLDPTEAVDVQSRHQPRVQAALTELRGAAEALPRRDNDPLYTPLPRRPWYRQPTVRSQVWKVGVPRNRAPVP